MHGFIDFMHGFLIVNAFDLPFLILRPLIFRDQDGELSKMSDTYNQHILY